MSWMRSPLYVWEDMGGTLHIWVRKGSPKVRMSVIVGHDNFAGGIAMEREIFDALVLFRHAELETDPREMALALKSADSHAGNIGSEAYTKQRKGGA